MRGFDEQKTPNFSKISFNSNKKISHLFSKFDLGLLGNISFPTLRNLTVTNFSIFPLDEGVTSGNICKVHLLFHQSHQSLVHKHSIIIAKCANYEDY